MITKYSSNQISLLNHEHLDVIEWVKYSDHKAIVDGLRIILDTDLNYQGALADCKAFEAKIVKSKTKIDTFKDIADKQVIEIAELKAELNSLDSFAMSPKRDAEVIRTMLSSDKLKLTPMDNLETIAMIIEEYADYLGNEND